MVRLLFFSEPEYHYAVSNLKGDGNVILGKLTLTQVAYESLKNLSEKGDFLFAHKSLALAQGYLKHILAYNFQCIIEPISIDLISESEKCIAVEANVYKESVKNNQILVFDGFLMDRSTLIHIGFAMDLDDLIYPQDLLNKYKPCHSSDQVLSEMIYRNNQFRSELGLINQIMDDAIIAVDVQGMVQIYSNKAQGLFNYSVDSVLGNNGVFNL